MLFRTRTTRAGRSAIIHEVIHVFAPNGNRFLAEGIAVYAHEYLEGRDAYQNFGYELHEAAMEHLDSANLSAMDDIATPRPMRTQDLDRKEAYIIAGSFIKFLIKTHGMENFRRLYAMTPMRSYSRNGGSPERWSEIYGVDLKTLENSWKEMVGSR